MKTKKVTRHYCDHCSKGLFNKYRMQQHEQTCIKNPKRSCYLCAAERIECKPMEVLIAALNESFEELRFKAECCPACILATIVQTKHNRDEDDYIEYDYKKAKALWEEERGENAYFYPKVSFPINP